MKEGETVGKVIRLKTPVTTEEVRKLRAKDNVLITGVIYTGRDAAHKRLVELINSGKNFQLI